MLENPVENGLKHRSPLYVEGRNPENFLACGELFTRMLY